MKEIDPNIIVPSILSFLGIVVVALKSSAATRKLEKRIKEIESQNRELEKENNDLKEKIRFFTDIPLILNPDGIYYTKEGIPFCSACYAKGTFSPLKKNSESKDSNRRDCPTCDSFFFPR